MSDAAHIESAWRHRDKTALAQWHGLQPDEAMMASEEALEACGERANFDWLLESLFVYLFADNAAKQWEHVAVRAAYVIRRCAIWMLVHESSAAELERLKSKVVSWDSFGTDAFLELCAEDDFKDALEAILVFLYPPHKRRLENGTRRTYLVARAFMPHLALLDGQPLTLERLASIFEGCDGEGKAAGNARSRWSARVKQVLRRTIDSNGSAPHVAASKSVTARSKMANSAKGNTNRKGTSKKIL
jgi:hypothetical protein